MSHLPDELRLAILIAVNVFVFIAAYRFVRRVTGQDWIGTSLDALLIHYLVQYVSVCVPGLLGILQAETMLLVAVVLGALLWWSSRRADFGLHVSDTNAIPTCGPKPARGLVLACLLFVMGYFGALVYTLGSASLVGDDALTYHLPAAGHWLQIHRLSLYNTWFFNPANTYSPLAGSTFLLWLMAPIRVDLLADFAQMPALILIFFAIIQIARSLGASEKSAAIAGVAALLSRPFISEAILVKDDQFLAAFFLAIVAGCGRTRVKDSLGPWRIGTALGLFFATKYTALLTAPLLLLVLDSPLNGGWKARRWLIMFACAFVVAAPWYLRNWALTGNPIYPVPVRIAGFEIFKGMFIPERSTEMRTIGGAWHALTAGFHSPSQALVMVLLVLWLIALILHARQLKSNPLARICLIGPILGLAIFFLASHAALIRYAYPSLLLLFICVALVRSTEVNPTRDRSPGRKSRDLRPGLRWGLRWLIVVFVACLSIWGGFEDKELLAWFLAGAVATVLFALPVSFLLVPQKKGGQVHLNPETRVKTGANSRASSEKKVNLTPFFLCQVGGWTVVVLVAAGWVFVYWHALILGSHASMMISYQSPYPQKCQMWRFIEENIPTDKPIAYTNLVFTRPLMGFDYSRRVFYVPTRPGVRNYSDLPNSDVRVTDQEIRAFVARLLAENPDHDLWLKNLLDSDADYLLVGRQSVLEQPPEKAFADADPAHFAIVREDASGALYQIRR